MNGKVSLSENFIANPYQILNQILFYKQYDCFITDLDLNIVEQLPIHFVLKDDRQFTFTSNPDTILGKEYQHNHLVPCNGKLYVILNDVLFSVFLNIFTEIATIPEMTQMNSNCLCAFEDKLIATNYYKLFLLENNEFVEQSLCSEYSENVESIFLESFGSTAIIGLQIGYCSCLCQIVALDNYKLLYLGHRLDKWLLDGGLCVLNVDYNNSCLVLDLTQQDLRVSFSTSVYEAHRTIVFSYPTKSFGSQIMCKLLPNQCQQFKSRQKQIFNIIIQRTQIPCGEKVYWRDIKPKIQIQECTLINSYQIPEHIICYNNETAFVVNDKEEIVMTVPIKIRSKTLKEHAINFYKNKTVSQLHFCKIYIFNSKLYSIFNDRLWEINLFEFIEMIEIPEMVSNTSNNHQLNMCTVGNKLLVTNEQKIWSYDQKNNQLDQFDLKRNNKIFAPYLYQCGLYSFCNQAIAIMQDNEQESIIQIFDDGNIELLYCGSQLLPQTPAGDVFPIMIGGESNNYVILIFNDDKRISLEYQRNYELGKVRFGLGHIQYQKRININEQYHTYIKQLTIKRIDIHSLNQFNKFNRNYWFYSQINDIFLINGRDLRNMYSLTQLGYELAQFQELIQDREE
ncbi:Hypothetical_protein [Hexamita inflata]|uniref:Hypothetical_protein n=1 Tax=Hexamita inflata TaxID=28002 RepID=A0ABP1IKP4_9EUKA